MLHNNCRVNYSRTGRERCYNCGNVMQEVDLGAVVSWVCRKCGTEIVEHEYDDDVLVEKIYRRKRNKVVI